MYFFLLCINSLIVNEKQSNNVDDCVCDVLLPSNFVMRRCRNRINCCIVTEIYGKIGKVMNVDFSEIKYCAFVVRCMGNRVIIIDVCEMTVETIEKNCRN